MDMPGEYPRSVCFWNIFSFDRSPPVLRPWSAFPSAATLPPPFTQQLRVAELISNLRSNHLTSQPSGVRCCAAPPRRSTRNNQLLPEAKWKPATMASLTIALLHNPSEEVIKQECPPHPPNKVFIPQANWYFFNPTITKCALSIKNFIFLWRMDLSFSISLPKIGHLTTKKVR